MKQWFDSFWYNFGWSDWVSYVDGWIPRLSLSVPLLGYLILFNDQVGKALEFVHLTSATAAEFGLTGSQRLRFVYFALLVLGLSNFIYRLRKPYAFRYGSSLVEYTRTCLDVLKLGDFVNMHGRVRSEGHLTLDGKYYDSEWDGFLSEASNPGEGTDKVVRSGSWENAKSKYGSLLRSMLRETFFRQDTGRRGWLAACVVLSTVGYLLLLAPSLDLFAKVVRSTVAP